jgi:hypothetical protein
MVGSSNRQNEIRMDIKASDTKDDASLDLSLSPDFPNGGARVISQALGRSALKPYLMRNSAMHPSNRKTP